MQLDRKTIENDEDYLRQISTSVDFEKDDYLEYIEALKEYCRNNAVYALAPVQIGIPKRMIYFRNTTPDMTPVIITAKGHTRFIERCASCMDFVGTVDRPYSVEVEYYDVNGNKKHEVFEEFKSTVFCHKFDHLNGILHIDLADDVRQMTWEETKLYRDKHPYEVLSKDDEYSFGSRVIKKLDESRKE